MAKWASPSYFHASVVWFPQTKCSTSPQNEPPSDDGAPKAAHTSMTPMNALHPRFVRNLKSYWPPWRCGRHSSQCRWDERVVPAAFWGGCFFFTALRPKSPASGDSNQFQKCVFWPLKRGPNRWYHVEMPYSTFREVVDTL